MDLEFFDVTIFRRSFCNFWDNYTNVRLTWAFLGWHFCRACNNGTIVLYFLEDWTGSSVMQVSSCLIFMLLAVFATIIAFGAAIGHSFVGIVVVLALIAVGIFLVHMFISGWKT